MTEEKKAATSQNVKRQGSSLQFVWRLMSQGFINGMISLREISNLKVVISVVIGLSKRKMDTQHNFAVVVDDHDMQISHVIRGDDHIANTPKQLMVYEALGWEAPEFGHMTLIINSETGKKLSKRDTNTLQFIEDYRKKRLPSEAVFNFIALLGLEPWW